MRYRLSSLLALVVYAMTPAGHDSITAAAQCCRRAAPAEPAAFGLPCHPLLGRYRVPSEKTPRSVLGHLDPAELRAADGKCLRGARPPDSSRVLVLSAVRHGHGITQASHEKACIRPGAVHLAGGREEAAGAGGVPGSRRHTRTR